MSAETNLIRTPQDFLDGRYGKGYLGDIREVSMQDALGRLTVIARDRGLGRAGIALLARRQEDAPGTTYFPEDGLAYPLFPSPASVNQEEWWMTMRDDFIHIARVPGELHAYDAEAIILRP
jgi:hypothetical protein